MGWRVSQGGEDVPGRGDGEEDEGAWDEVKLSE